MNYVFAPPTSVSAPVTGTGARFPVHRIYCVGSNYRAHAQEMGRTGREPRYHMNLGERADWTWAGEPLGPLKGYPGVMMQRARRRPRALTPDDIL